MSLTKLSESAVLTGLSKVPPFPPIAARLLVMLANESVDIRAALDAFRQAQTAAVLAKPDPRGP